jgi:hypothetical protein
MRRVVAVVAGHHVDAVDAQVHRRRQRGRDRSRPLEIDPPARRKPSRRPADESQRIIDVLDEVTRQDGGKARIAELRRLLRPEADLTAVVAVEVAFALAGVGEQPEIAAMEQRPFPVDVQSAVAGANVEHGGTRGQRLQEAAACAEQMERFDRLVVRQAALPIGEEPVLDRIDRVRHCAASATRDGVTESAGEPDAVFQAAMPGRAVTATPGSAASRRTAATGRLA